MSGSTFVLVELLAAFGLVIVFCVWELRRLHQDKKRREADRARASRPSDRDPSAPDPSDPS
ncbi:MAG: hypothetical protein ACFB6R_08700 [Alphaproteobacteria bacterium]